MKDLRFYIVPSSRIEELNDMEDAGSIIEDWNEDDVLCDKAMAFIKIAEEIGSVYSLRGLMVAFNIIGDISSEDYLFVTNKY